MLLLLVVVAYLHLAQAFWQSPRQLRSLDEIEEYNDDQFDTDSLESASKETSDLEKGEDGKWRISQEWRFMTSIKCSQTEVFMDYMNTESFNFLKCSKTALYEAAKHNCLAILTALINDPHVDVLSGRGKAIVLAAEKGLYRNLEALLAVSNKWPIKALHLACASTVSPKCKQFLVQYMEKNRDLLGEPKGKATELDEDIFGQFLGAISTGDLELVRHFINTGVVEPNFEDNFALKLACSKEQTEIAKFLLTLDGVDPSVDSNFCLRAAVYTENCELVRVLVKDGRCDPSFEDCNCLIFASGNGMSDVVRDLLKDPRIRPDAQNNYAVELATHRCHPETMLVLMADDRVDPYEHVTETMLAQENAAVRPFLPCQLNDPRNAIFAPHLCEYGKARFQFNYYLLCHAAIKIEQVELAVKAEKEATPDEFPLTMCIGAFRKDPTEEIPKFHFPQFNDVEMKMRCSASCMYWGPLTLALDEYLTLPKMVLLIKDEGSLELDQWLCTIDYALMYLFRFGQSQLIFKILRFLLPCDNLFEPRHSAIIDLLVSRKTIQLYHNVKYLLRCAKKVLILQRGLPFYPVDILTWILAFILNARTWPN